MESLRESGLRIRKNRTTLGRVDYGVMVDVMEIRIKTRLFWNWYMENIGIFLLSNIETKDRDSTKVDC